MSTADHRKVAVAFQKALYVSTEEMLESGPSYEKSCVMVDALVKRMIPLSWPKASRETLKAIAIRIPLVNYLAPKKEQLADAKKIEAILLDNFPVRSAGRKASASTIPRSKKRGR